ncbi:MAG: squalene--hopene cyclase [Rhodospirillaceae bacterium]|nr:squalene--hopene cyclase [Rhodospirillaceae bacterium]
MQKNIENSNAANSAGQHTTLDEVIQRAKTCLLDCRSEDGHWAFPLEADVTIPAEYILLNHYLGEINDDVEAKLANYIRRIQGFHGGWPLYHNGDLNVSASVKAYFALKLAGDHPAAPHMIKARDAILAHGGAKESNVFTRITLALFGLVPWRATPVTRIEVLFAPKWFPLHLNKVSYWTRTVTVPLLILTALRPRAKNPRNVSLDELFTKSRFEEDYRIKNPTGNWLGSLMTVLDRLAWPFEKYIPNYFVNRGIARAMNFITERLNGEDGLGGIFPAMANALMAFDALGIPKDHPNVITARKAIEKLLIFQDDEAYCQPCLSPVWDTGLAAHAMLEAGQASGPRAIEDDTVAKSCNWLEELQIKDCFGDWAIWRPGIRPGGWAFQYRNDYYPDIDDTAVVAMALHRTGNKNYEPTIQRAAEWVVGMQSKSGGWAAFDADNEYHLLENMPYADHGALLDPPSADVSARCISFLAQIGFDNAHPAIRRGLIYLTQEQEKDGSWFGRWGTNYIYGTWSVLSALNAAGENMQADYVRKAVYWLFSVQHEDGGWGEDCASYWQNHDQNNFPLSLPSQTAWAVLGLMAAGESKSEAVKKGIQFLLDTCQDDGDWQEEHFNAVGFPRVFYLRYHGYRLYFPLLALARYQNLENTNTDRPAFGL